MERTDKKIQFKKVGGGSLRLGGKIIKPNEVFSAHPWDIPESFRDVCVPLEEIPEEEKETIEVVDSKYELSHRNGPWYDVVDGEGKVLNEKAMNKEAAQKLIKQLEEL